MNAAFSRKDLAIASPCPASWDGMKGDDRARFCDLCEKHVYNIASMTVPEVEDLIVRTEGDFCGRIYRRRDGTVLTADCPVGRRQAPRRLMRRVIACSVIGFGFLSTGALLRGASKSEWDWPPTGPGVTASDWWDWALTTVGLRPKPGLTPKYPVILGKIRCLPRSPMTPGTVLDAAGSGGETTSAEDY